MSLKLIGLTIVLTLTLLLSGCGSKIASRNKIDVAAAENFYGELAASVGGERVAVTPIMASGADPHDYEPTLKTSKLVSDAQVVLYNGIGYDDWMMQILSASSDAGDKMIIAVGSDILGKQAGDNPHVWYDPTTMPKLANRLADDLSRLDPDHAADYRQRAAEYIASLTPLTNLVQTVRQKIPRETAVSEPVCDYMLEALNFKAIDPQFAKAIEEETDPSPRDVANLQTAVKAGKLPFFVQNIQADNPTVNHIVALAKASKIPIIPVTETEPVGQDYLQWMTGILKQIQAAMLADKE